MLQMSSVWEMVFAHLPADLAGTQVFSFLSVEDLVRLDSAVLNNQRETLKGFYAFATIAAAVAETKQFVWKWCANRKIRIKQVRFANVTEVDQDSLGVRAREHERWNRCMAVHGSRPHGP